MTTKLELPDGSCAIVFHVNGDIDLFVPQSKDFGDADVPGKFLACIGMTSDDEILESYRARVIDYMAKATDGVGGLQAHLNQTNQ